MKQEEKELLLKDLCARKFYGHYDSTMAYKSFDRLNEHHFDYRGLIGKGLALEAPAVKTLKISLFFVIV